MEDQRENLVWVLVGRGTGLACLEQSPGVGCPKRGTVRWLSKVKDQ